MMDVIPFVPWEKFYSVFFLLFLDFIVKIQESEHSWRLYVCTDLDDNALNKVGFRYGTDSLTDWTDGLIT